MYCKTRSDVIKKALALLWRIQLEACYREANAEIDDVFEMTNLDGDEENKAS